MYISFKIRYYIKCLWKTHDMADLTIPPQSVAVLIPNTQEYISQRNEKGSYVYEGWCPNRQAATSVVTVWDSSIIRLQVRQCSSQLSAAVTIILLTLSFNVFISTFYRLRIRLLHINHQSSFESTDAMQLILTQVFRICGTFSFFHHVQIGFQDQVSPEMKWDGAWRWLSTACRVQI